MCHILHFDLYFCDRCLVWEPSYGLPTYFLFIFRSIISCGEEILDLIRHLKSDGCDYDDALHGWLTTDGPFQEPVLRELLTQTAFLNVSFLSGLTA